VPRVPSLLRGVSLPAGTIPAPDWPKARVIDSGARFCIISIGHLAREARAPADREGFRFHGGLHMAMPADHFR
jgi:hypothetical protein